MSKRVATSIINRDNWDKEEEPEEHGVFQKADPEILQKRVIKTARRRSGTNSYGKPSPFSTFAGFGSATSPTTSSPFSFLKQNTNNAQETPPKVNQDTSLTKSDKDKESEKKSQNLETLKDLNLSCNKWITEHLQKNPYCILTPIFKDYEMHLSQLELDTEGEKKKDEPFKFPLPSVSDTVKPFRLSGEKSNKEETEEKETAFKLESPSNVLYNFSPGEDKQYLGSFKLNDKYCGYEIGTKMPTFQFNKTTNNGNSDTSPGKLNLNVGAGDLQKEGDKEEDESNEPPKSDFVPVVEEDSLYDKRCKIFFKKDSKFVAKGIGTLFLKPVKDSKNTQLIVRADTSSGNIVLNILLTPSLPIQKTGKNNVMIVCVPNPECKPPPIPVLIRVKTSEDCDEVMRKLEEYKGV